MLATKFLEELSDICEPYLTYRTFITFELFTILLSKRCSYKSEPYFQTKTEKLCSDFHKSTQPDFVEPHDLSTFRLIAKGADTVYDNNVLSRKREVNLIGSSCCLILWLIFLQLAQTYLEHARLRYHHMENMLRNFYRI